MYIRRKVFSLLQDETGEERYFSTTEFEDERLYTEDDNDDEPKVEKKMRFDDKQNIKRLKRMYKRRHGEELKDIHMRQMDEDPEVRKQADKDLLKKGAKRSAVVTGILVPASAAAGYGIGRGLMKEGRKESLKMAGYGAGGTLAGAATGTAVGLGSLAIDNAIKNKKLKKDNEKYYHKTRDQVRTAAGEMTEEEYTNKWGKTKRKK